MGVGRIHAADLAGFVAEIDNLGGISHPDAVAAVADFELGFDTQVDTTLDPFSDDYRAAMLELYQELSGRGDVEPELTEQTPIEVDDFVATANPYGSVDSPYIAHHVRTILTALLVADAGPEPRVLDMGAGWGLSTETLAFCGAQVTAVDINPQFLELIERRVAVRNYDVESVLSRFESVAVEGEFDVVFFYECLHHAVSPEAVIGQIADRVGPEGKIVLAAEPIGTEWWPAWGLRLDPQSVYCINKFGWFESGWSADFLAESFRRCGFDLTILRGIGYRHGDIGVAVRTGADVEPPSAHWATPPPPPYVEPDRGRVERAARAVARRLLR